MIEEAVVPYNFEEIKFEADDQPHEQVYQQAVNEELARIKKLEKAIEQSCKPYLDAVKRLSQQTLSAYSDKQRMEIEKEIFATLLNQENKSLVSRISDLRRRVQECEQRELSLQELYAAIV